MIQRLLLALDGSRSSDIAQATALSIASACRARVNALGIIDTPWITRPEALPIGGSAYKVVSEIDQLRRAHSRRSAACENFSKAAAGQRVTATVNQKEGDPVSLLADESVTNDLIVIGRQTAFRYLEPEEESTAVAQLVQANPRPVLLTSTTPSTIDRVLIAFDGSIPASRALHMFALLGLGVGREVKVLSIFEASSTAEEHACRAGELLDSHGVKSEPIGIGSNADAAELILTHSKAWQAGLVVMGAFGHRGLQSLFFGSCTRRLLRESPTALFVHH